MKPREKSLAIAAGALLAISVISMSLSAVVCLVSAICALALSLYLRRRGAFRNGNAPLAGVFLISGSGMTALLGLAGLDLRVAMFVLAAFLIPIFLFLMIFGLRERLRAIDRYFQRLSRDDETPPP